MPSQKQIRELNKTVARLRVPESIMYHIYLQPKICLFSLFLPLQELSKLLCETLISDAYARTSIDEDEHTNQEAPQTHSPLRYNTIKLATMYAPRFPHIRLFLLTSLPTYYSCFIVALFIFYFVSPFLY
jgi:hypothetical protein